MTTYKTGDIAYSERGPVQIIAENVRIFPGSTVLGIAGIATSDPHQIRFWTNAGVSVNAADVESSEVSEWHLYDCPPAPSGKVYVGSVPGEPGREMLLISDDVQRRAAEDAGFRFFAYSPTSEAALEPISSCDNASETDGWTEAVAAQKSAKYERLKIADTVFVVVRVNGRLDRVVVVRNGDQLVNMPHNHHYALFVMTAYGTYHPIDMDRALSLLGYEKISGTLTPEQLSQLPGFCITGHLTKEQIEKIKLEEGMCLTQTQRDDLYQAKKNAGK